MRRRAFAFRRAGLDRCGIAVVALDGFDETVVREAAATLLMEGQRIEVTIVDHLPRNDNGKNERLKLRTIMEERQGRKASAV